MPIETHGIALYPSYVGNDPLDRTDPAGTGPVGAEWLQQTQALGEAEPAGRSGGWGKASVDGG
jgi:hypothetical protein